MLEGAIELMQRIRADFKYDTKATVVSTPISEAFEKRRGVCQDFAHIMIAGLRGLGLPAAYVSGYIRTIPPPGKKRLQGADAMHAWVSLWCGADIGWVDLDPTNSMLIGNDHIVLAKGRDYADISPVAGHHSRHARAGRRCRGRCGPTRGPARPEPQSTAAAAG